MSLPKNSQQSKTNPTEVGRITTPSLRCSQLTALGRSAIAVIGVQGEGAGKVILNYFSPSTKRRFSPGNLYFGLWSHPELPTNPPEAVVVTTLTPETFEIHCHGGVAAVERILDDLIDCGVERVSTSQWNRQHELLCQEAEHVLQRCVTARTAAIALDQFRGALASRVRGWMGAVAGGGPETLNSVRQQAADLLAKSQFTRRMTEPIRVVIAGPPNVGKSSLVNAMVGFDRSITMDAAGTTRDVLHADTVIDGLPIRLSDTAGIRRAATAIEAAGIARAQVAADAADLIVWVDDPHTLATGPASEVRSGPTPTVRVRNKCDLLHKVDLSLASSGDPAPEMDAFWIDTSAVTERGLDRLMAAIVSPFTAHLPAQGCPAAINRRQATLLEGIAASETLDCLQDKLQQLRGVSDAAGDIK